MPGVMPVAQPGCPMDHIQTLVNRSPGDLWMRFIGNTDWSPRFFSSSHGAKNRDGKTGGEPSWAVSGPGDPFGGSAVELTLFKDHVPAHDDTDREDGGQSFKRRPAATAVQGIRING